MNNRAFPAPGYTPAASAFRDIDVPLVPCRKQEVLRAMLLQTGARVRVDGGAGTVQLLSQPEAAP